VVLFLLVFFSCNPSKPPPREFFIPRDELVEILVDMHMVRLVQTTPQYKDLARDYDSIDIYSNIFRKHNTTQQAFDSMIIYYSRTPKDLITIYDEVIMKLTMLNDSLMPDDYE